MPDSSLWHIVPLNREIGVDIPRSAWYDSETMECRIVLTKTGASTEVGMYDPGTGRYAPVGHFGPAEVDRVIRDMVQRIEKEGHTVTFATRHG